MWVGRHSLGLGVCPVLWPAGAKWNLAQGTGAIQDIVWQGDACQAAAQGFQQGASLLYFQPEVAGSLGHVRVVKVVGLDPVAQAGPEQGLQCVHVVVDVF